MKFDFADYIRIADRIHECDLKRLNAWAKVPLKGVEFIGVQILDRKDFGDEPLTAIVNRLVKRSIMCKLKVKEVDEANNAVEYVFKWINTEEAL